MKKVKALIEACKKYLVVRYAPLGEESIQWGLKYTYPDERVVFENKPSREYAAEIAKIHRDLDRQFTVEIVWHKVVHYDWQTEESNAKI